MHWDVLIVLIIENIYVMEKRLIKWDKLLTMQLSKITENPFIVK